MKSVLISIRPKWCKLIESGKKTIEVRKTKPKCDVPFRCYIYCTNPRHYVDKHHYYSYPQEPLWLTDNNGVVLKLDRNCGDYHFLNGKVIGEFVCDRIGEAHWLQDVGYAGVYKEWKDNEDCIPNKELLNYMGEKNILYGWHISELKIYDEPKELNEFFTCHNRSCEAKCPAVLPLECITKHKAKCVTRPPQSWCYVERCEE